MVWCCPSRTWQWFCIHSRIPRCNKRYTSSAPRGIALGRDSMLLAPGLKIVIWSTRCSLLRLLWFIFPLNLWIRYVWMSSSLHGRYGAILGDTRASADLIYRFWFGILGSSHDLDIYTYKLLTAKCLEAKNSWKSGTSAVLDSPC